MRKACVVFAFWWCAGALLAEDSLSHAKRSYQLLQAGDRAGAEAEIRDAIHLEPTSPLFHSALAGILQQNGKADDAFAEWETALTLHPPDAARTRILQVFEEAMLECGAQLGSAGKYGEGLKLGARAENHFPKSERVLLMLGFFQSKERLHSDAVKTYGRVMAINPASADGALGLGIAQSACGLENEATRTLEAARKIHAEDARFSQAMGNLLVAKPDQSLPDAAKAKVFFEAALAIDPSLAESHYQLGVLANRLGRPEEARRHWDEASKLNPADGRVHFALARLYRLANRPEEAQRELASFLQAQNSAERR